MKGLHRVHLTYLFACLPACLSALSACLPGLLVGGQLVGTMVYINHHAPSGQKGFYGGLALAGKAGRQTDRWIGQADRIGVGRERGRVCTGLRA